MISDAMKALNERMTCLECSATRIKPNSDSPYGLCPNGHGRLVKMRAKDAKHLEVSERLPEATKVGANKFRIEERDGTYGFSNQSGWAAVDLDDPLPAGWVNAYLYNGDSLRVRSFLLKKPMKIKVVA